MDNIINLAPLLSTLLKLRVLFCPERDLINSKLCPVLYKKGQEMEKFLNGLGIYGLMIGRLECSCCKNLCLGSIASYCKEHPYLPYETENKIRCNKYKISGLSSYKQKIYCNKCAIKEQIEIKLGIDYDHEDQTI